MDIKTFRAGSLQEALNRVRDELGPDAAVLQTREVRAGWLGLGRREVEVLASVDVWVPSRLPPRELDAEEALAVPVHETLSTSSEVPVKARGRHVGARADLSPPPLVSDYRQAFRPTEGTLTQGPSVVADLCGTSRKNLRSSDPVPSREQPPVNDTSRHRPLSAASPTLLDSYHELLDAEFSADQARELLDRATADLTGDDNDADGPAVVKSRIARLIEQDLKTTGPLAVTPGRRRVVAFVGPTGVGKTTTIAKLAAQFRLREHRRVGLVSLDTYRIAAVEQLRTYADLIDLPLEVVSTPREMGQAMQRFADLDLVLIDTAGRSPCDEIRIHELRAFLHEAQADEIQLVLSCGTNVRQLEQVTDRFAVAGVTAVLLTKLDESTALGGLFPWLRACQVPLSYLTTGQNVPQDIEPADRKKFARRLLSSPNKTS